MKNTKSKELDKFIKEKLAISRDISGLDNLQIDFSEKRQQIVEHFSNSIKKQECSTKIKCK